MSAVTYLGEGDMCFHNGDSLIHFFFCFWTKLRTYVGENMEKRGWESKSVFTLSISIHTFNKPYRGQTADFPLWCVDIFSAFKL